MLWYHRKVVLHCGTNYYYPYEGKKYILSIVSVRTVQYLLKVSIVRYLSILWFSSLSDKRVKSDSLSIFNFITGSLIRHGTFRYILLAYLIFFVFFLFIYFYYFHTCFFFFLSFFVFFCILVYYYSSYIIVICTHIVLYSVFQKTSRYIFYPLLFFTLVFFIYFLLVQFSVHRVRCLCFCSIFEFVNFPF